MPNVKELEKRVRALENCLFLLGSEIIKQQMETWKIADKLRNERGENLNFVAEVGAWRALNSLTESLRKALELINK